MGENAGGGQIADAYAIGGVSGQGSTAGVAGINAGALTNIYWDTAASGTNVGVADGASGSAMNITPIGGTGPSPDAQATYEGFDFANVWTIQPGPSRPVLQTAPQSAPPG